MGDSAYDQVKAVAKDAYGVGSEAAKYVYGDVEADGTPTAPANGQMQDVPADGFKPTAGNSVAGGMVDGVMNNPVGALTGLATGGVGLAASALGTEAGGWLAKQVGAGNEDQ